MSWIAPITYETASPEVREILDKRYGDLLEYYVSLENGAVIAVPYYKKCLMDAGIDPDHTVFDDKDRSVRKLPERLPIIQR